MNDLNPWVVMAAVLGSFVTIVAMMLAFIWQLGRSTDDLRGTSGRSRFAEASSVERLRRRVDRLEEETARIRREARQRRYS